MMLCATSRLLLTVSAQAVVECPGNVHLWQSWGMLQDKASRCHAHRSRFYPRAVYMVDKYECLVDVVSHRSARVRELSPHLDPQSRLNPTRLSQPICLGKILVRSRHGWACTCPVNQARTRAHSRAAGSFVKNTLSRWPQSLEASLPRAKQDVDSLRAVHLLHGLERSKVSPTTKNSAAQTPKLVVEIPRLAGLLTLLCIVTVHVFSLETLRWRG